MIHVPSAIRPGLGFSLPADFWENLPGLVTAGAQGTTAILSQVQKPYVIPGSGGVVYYPSQGAGQTNVGTTLQNAGTAAAWGLAPVALIAGIGLIVVLVVMKK